MIISFCIIFLKNLSRVMRHTKKGKIQGKTKNWKNHEGSCNLGKTFWNPKKLLISSIEKKYQLCALLESGIGGLRKTLEQSFKNVLLHVNSSKNTIFFKKLKSMSKHLKNSFWQMKPALYRYFWTSFHHGISGFG